jgi:hypothetical protein
MLMLALLGGGDPELVARVEIEAPGLPEKGPVRAGTLGRDEVVTVLEAAVPIVAGSAKLVVTVLRESQLSFEMEHLERHPGPIEICVPSGTDPEDALAALVGETGAASAVTDDPTMGPDEVKERLRASSRSLRELRDAGILRSVNTPSGDYAEWLVARCTGGELAPRSQRRWDVRTPDGEHLQVKARVVSDPPTAGQRQLSSFRS